MAFNLVMIRPLLLVQCTAGTCLSTVATDLTEVNICDTDDGTCKCGTTTDNAATCANPNPKCLAADGSTVPDAEDTAGTTCKVI